MMNSHLDSIWKELENTIVYAKGILKKRYSPDCLADLYLGVKVPEHSRLLLVRLSWKTGKSISDFPTLRGIRVEKLADEESSDKHIFLNLVLTESLFADVFSVLAEDIIGSVCELLDEKLIVQQFINRLHQWRALFEKYREEGLNPEQQRGLYGELYFLRKLLSVHTAKLLSAKSWIGYSKAAQDFQFSHLAIEVKTSTSKQHQKIYISNERQLDDSTIESLFLFHLSLDVRQAHGETLPEIVSSIKDSLKDESETLSLFQYSLLQAGYFDGQKELYKEYGYTIRDEHLFKVENDFPRLTEKDIPAGIGDIKYSIDVSLCLPYQFPFENLTALLTQYES